LPLFSGFYVVLFERNNNLAGEIGAGATRDRTSGAAGVTKLAGAVGDGATGVAGATISAGTVGDGSTGATFHLQLP
jgi:hypothetical protein